jgi:tetratricopeptide (TPR) repeat protein
MWHRWRILAASVLLLPASIVAQETHAPRDAERLGRVTFSISCLEKVQPEFNRGVALLHSFAYAAAEKTFQEVAERDPKCAMAHWGTAMTYFRELWDPPILPATIPTAQREIELAEQIGAGTERERRFINALSLIYLHADTVAYRTRAANYQRTMGEIAAENPKDTESQVFYALALLATASPMDKTHANQKKAAELLEPLRSAYPQHPGISHYLIHAYDNAELAPRGLSAAREYSKIAPAAPHALHMPSHIFTRLGLWDESIGSNLAARDAAHEQGDTGEELHAMDYLVYAYLQEGRDAEAERVIRRLGEMTKLEMADFKIAYASSAMPIRYAVERGQWEDAANIVPAMGAPPHVVAIGVWARGIGLARSGRAKLARPEIERLNELEKQLRKTDNEYWSRQVGILLREVRAWSEQAEGKPAEAAALLRDAADEEDAIEKLPVTPGPILPAREQLGELLLEQNRPKLAVKEFKIALVNAPGRRGAIQGAARAKKLLRQTSDGDSSAESRADARRLDRINIEVQNVRPAHE